MMYLVQYCIQMFATYKAIQIPNSKQGMKGYKHASRHVQVKCIFDMKENQVKLSLIAKCT